MKAALALVLSLTSFAASAASINMTLPGGDPHGLIAVSMSSRSTTTLVYERAADGIFVMKKNESSTSGYATVWLSIVPIFMPMIGQKTTPPAIGYLQIAGPSKVIMHHTTGQKNELRAQVTKTSSGLITGLRVGDAGMAEVFKSTFRHGNVGVAFNMMGNLGFLNHFEGNTGEMVCRGSKRGGKQILECVYGVALRASGRTSIDHLKKVTEQNGSSTTTPATPANRRPR